MNKILVVDDDPVILESLKNILTKAKYHVTATGNPLEAIHLYETDPTNVVISDLLMPEMSGKDFMLKLYESGHKPLVIVLTMMNDSRTIIDLFKSGAHDYIIKPFSSNELVMKVNKAYELAELRILNENMQKEREIRFEHQFNWNIFKDTTPVKKITKSDTSLIDGIKTSFLQGSGIGALVPLIEMIKKSAKVEGEDFLVKKKLLQMLFDNAEFLNRLIQAIGDIDYVINTDLPMETISVLDLHRFVEDIVQELSKFESIRSHSIVLTKLLHDSNSKTIHINKEFLKKAIHELLFNAFKFSEEGTKIFILFEVIKDHVLISILNYPDSTQKDHEGIKPEYQSIIFEPFFRISRYVYESYPTLDFGLGLCTVDRILRNHKGKVRVSNLKNHIEPNKGVLINFTLEIPFAY